MSWILLVEGQDDLHVIRNFLFERGLDLSDQLKASGGNTSLLELLRATLIGGAQRVVAAVIDSDSDMPARWQSIRDSLSLIGYSLPAQPDERGTVIQGVRTLGLWLMPDNALPGKLENFVELLIPPDDSLWPRARTAVGDIPQPDRRFSPAATIKAELHTWLAWQEEPGTRMGAAITKRYLQTGGVTANAFVEWVERLQAADRE